jgi:hypothetical protein
MHDPDDKPKKTNNVKNEETIQLCTDICKTQATKNIEIQNHRPIPSTNLPTSKPSQTPRANLVSEQATLTLDPKQNKQPRRKRR